jgi:PhoH-like ATPase
LEDTHTEYTGYKTFRFSEDELVNFYTSMNNNEFACLNNEYIVIEDEAGNLVDAYRWTGDKFIKAPYKVINSKFVGRIKPKNTQQRLAIDMLYNDSITVKMLSGRYGTGKDYLMCAAAVDMLEKGKIDKIVYVRNNIEVKDSKPIGHLPGTGDEKLMPYAMVLADKLGGIDALNMLITQGKIELTHLGFMRGRDIKNAIIYCTEAENITRAHAQLLLGRVGEGSSLWLNGDSRQTDMDVFARDGGMNALLERLRGNPMFGYVKLLKTERSPTAALADLLD